jgi:hypothetical protein
MRASFAEAMCRVATLGQKLEDMVDCSEVIPEPRTRVGQPHLPAGCSIDEIEKSVRAQVQSHKTATPDEWNMYSATSTRSRISSPTPALPALWSECKQGLTPWKSRSNHLLSALVPAKCGFLELLFMSFECLISLIRLASQVLSLYVLCFQFNLKELELQWRETRNIDIVYSFNIPETS